MLFGLEPVDLIHDEMPWTLIASFRANPDKKASMLFGKDGNGIATAIPERIAYDNIPHLITQLKKL